jgi:dipeptidase E
MLPLALRANELVLDPREQLTGACRAGRWTRPSSRRIRPHMAARRSSRRRAVLYSGGQERRNALIHETLLELALRSRPAPQRRGVAMTYMPYTREGARAFYRRFERRYRSFGATRFACVAADDPAVQPGAPAHRAAAETILASDVVYLAGGNTFYFLAWLRRSGLLAVLRRFAHRGGVLAGLSAGALILTPRIALAGYPPFDRDENDVGLPERQQTGLDLVGFEFFPHYRRSRRYRDALLAYSRRSRRPVYACPDGSGIVVEGDRFTAHGEVWQFEAGHASRVGG